MMEKQKVNENQIEFNEVLQNCGYMEKSKA